MYTEQLADVFTYNHMILQIIGIIIEICDIIQADHGKAAVFTSSEHTTYSSMCTMLLM